MGLFTAVGRGGHGRLKRRQRTRNSDKTRTWRTDFAARVRSYTVTTFGLVPALYAMADYLDARARYRSESVNTEASSTVASSSPLATPSINAKPTPLLSPKCPINTILKSHGRPPWYCYGRASSHLQVLK